MIAMLDLQTPLEQGMVDAPEQEGTDANARVQTTAPLLLRREFLEAAKAVEIAKKQEQRVGARRKNAGGEPQKYFLTEEGACAHPRTL